MHLLGGNTRCVTREKIGTKKGYSKVMVALVATRQLRLAFKKGKTHFYSLPDSVVCACDFETPTSTRIKATTYRILRNTALSQRIKLLHQNRCQICGFSIQLPDGTAYSEAHHIKPLGTPHDGPDIEQNIIVLCPNHHAMCDYGVVPLDIERLRSHEIHQVGVEFVLYHNSEIYVGSELDSS
ncbi:MAG: HNH endonuclease [Planctomycetaceae bacterium]|nr:HNH endonuclease [Planctomycetaceae bacterium]